MTGIPKMLFTPDDSSRCPVCGAAKAGTMSYRLGGRDIVRPVSCLCHCDRSEQAAMELAEEAERKAVKDSMRMRKAFGDRVPQGSFSRDDGRSDQAMVTCRAYAERFDAIRRRKVNGLALHGSARQGKTFAAEAVAVDLHRRGLSVLMDTAAGFVQRLNGDRTAAAALRERAARCDLLVIDDLGASRDTSFGRESLFSLIDARVSSRRPLLVTTNIDLSDGSGIAASDDQRSLLRVMERCLPVRVECGRTPYDGGAYDEAMEALGLKKTVATS